LDVLIYWLLATQLRVVSVRKFELDTTAAPLNNGPWNWVPWWIFKKFATF